MSLRTVEKGLSAGSRSVFDMPVVTGPVKVLHFSTYEL